MSDVQVESAKGQKRRGRKQVAAAEQPDAIDFDKAVAKGKGLVATLKSQDAAVNTTEMELGKLADSLTPIYGDKTLARFAKAIGISADRLNRCRSVYRAYKGKEIKGPAPKFAVYQALQGHPKRDEIIEAHRKANRKLTKREARTYMRDLRASQGQEEDWKVQEARSWLGRANNHALEAVKYGEPTEQYLNPATLRQAVDEPEKLMATLRAGGAALITLADKLQRALAPPAPMPATEANDAESPDGAEATSDEA
jgi:hypothetical protein